MTGIRERPGNITFTDLKPTTGIEVTGLSGGRLVDHRAADECLALVGRRGVVIYRDADLDDDEVAAFSRLLGDVLPRPLAAHRERTYFWHLDGTAAQATVFSAREADGDIEFANTFAAYEALSAADKAKLADVRVVHGFGAPREHPLVWTHRDGRRSLLVGATAGEVVGRSAEDGRALLDHLLKWATRPQFVIRHRWRSGDLVVWDNTAMLHRTSPVGK
jgi:alpha-ketoglutarate-dependent taurine dioxygenase